MHQFAADNSIGIELIRIHVHVSHTHVSARRIDKEIHSLLLTCAQDKTVMRGDHLMLIGKAPIGAIIEQRAGAWPDVLTLMALATRALADEIVAMLTEIIAPGI